MSVSTVRSIAHFLQGVPEITDNTPVVWHAGEPMVMPRSFYAEAFALFSQASRPNMRFVQSFQTNGTLITPAWCEFIKQHDIHIGVSVDGPDFIHNHYRVDRNGRGTFSKVLRGIKLLHAYDIPFSVIAVLTRDSLDSVREIWDFFKQNDIRSIGFNIEEIEGAHQTSSLEDVTLDHAYEQFFDELYALQRQDSEVGIRIRELEETRARVCSRSGKPVRNSENTVGSILNFSVDGGVSTFSPELLTAPPSARYQQFVWGNVHVDSYATVLSNVRSSLAYSDIRAGIAACKDGCEYFAVCGGGAPSNKLGEFGTMNATETMSCRLQVKALTRVVLNRLEAELDRAHFEEGS